MPSNNITDHRVVVRIPADRDTGGVDNVHFIDRRGSDISASRRAEPAGGTGEVTEMAEAAEFAARVGENADALGAVGEAGRTSKPVGVVSTLCTLWSPDVRAGLGYLVALLKAQERRSHQP